ncbi:MAG: glycosyltransferase family 2 protein [Thermoplasmata archaeon]|nr:glycosyltransferase family 2 protein [Thermoplasmata archaeon]
MSDPMITILIPTMNEEQSIGKVIERIKSSVKHTYEIVLIDNSRDKTPEIARSMGANVITEKRKGYGRAYKTGFKNVKGEIVVTLDGDNTYPPEVIDEYVDYLIKNDLDFISCERLTLLPKNSMSTAHKIGNFVLNIAFLSLFFIKLKDSQSGMWIFKSKIIPYLDVCSNGMAFSEELKMEAWSKFKAKELPIKYGLREGEKKLQTFKDGIKNLLYLIERRFKKCKGID